MRRLYSTFAGGWPGIGLMLMRIVVGFALATGAGTALLSRPTVAVTFLSVLLGAAAILLMIGLYTPIVGTLVAAIETFRLVTLPANSMVYLLIATVGAALAMLGPGLWSADARLFGWKRLEASPRKS